MRRGLIGFPLLIALFTLSGCAAQMQQAQENRERFERNIPTCEGEEDCRAKWEAAQVWVTKNAGYKIQNATSVLIETYNATGGSVQLSVRVVKEPLGGGRYKFVVSTWCDNIFGCSPDSWQAAHDFNRVVGAAVP